MRSARVLQRMAYTRQMKPALIQLKYFPYKIGGCAAPCMAIAG